MTLRPSLIVLVLANLVPVAGVLMFDWHVLDIVMLYWTENVVIGLINILRMAICRGPRRWFPALFFAAHYGLFCFGHLSALLALFGDQGSTTPAQDYFFAEPLAAAWKSPLWVGIAAITASHLYSFFTNFIAAGEYRRTTPMALMQRPYGRIVVLHVAILVGGVLVQLLGSPVLMLVVLIAIKVAMDLKLHTSERRKLGRVD